MSGLKQIMDRVTHVIKAERGFEILKMKSTVVSLLLSTAAVSVWAKPVYTGSAATQEFRAHEGGLPPAEKHAFAATSVRTVNVRTTKELFAARDRLRKKKPSVPVDVRIAPGEYFFEQPFALTASDSGSATAPIRYIGAGTATVFTAATRVPAARFQTWRNGILVADIADLGVRFPDRTKILGVRQSPPPVPEVFVDGARYEMASWPNDRQWTTFTNIVTVGAGWADKDGTNKLGRLNVPGTFGYDGDRPSRWTQAPYVWIHGYFRWDWRDNLLPVGGIDPKERTITLGARATYGLARGNPSPRRWRVVHLLEELDIPGEYYVDFKAKKLYLKPLKPLTAKTRVDIVAGADTIVTADCVTNVVFGNLKLCCASQALRAKRCSRLTLTELTVENIGNIAVTLNDASNALVESCDFHEIGGLCLDLNGGDRRTLVSAGNRVTDCDFGPAGIHARTGCAGFKTYGVGTVFDHNFVHDMPHHAIYVSYQGGNDCVFSHNVISNCCNESDDAGAFYKGRNPSACGNVLEGNVFIDCGKNGRHGTCAVYFDDGDSGDIVRENVFIRCGNRPRSPADKPWGAIFFNGGYAFSCVSNAFIDCASGATTSAPEGWCTDAWWMAHLKGLESRLLDEVCVTGAVYRAHYPWMKTLLPGLPVGERTNRLVHCSFANVPRPANGRTWCSPDCRHLDADDGIRPLGARQAGLVRKPK